MSANDLVVKLAVREKMLDEARERELKLAGEVGRERYHREEAERERDELREQVAELEQAALELDDMRAERDWAMGRVAELEGILQLLLRERNEEKFNDAPVFEPVRKGA